jgi:hypothetical protein
LKETFPRRIARWKHQCIGKWNRPAEIVQSVCSPDPVIAIICAEFVADSPRNHLA